MPEHKAWEHRHENLAEDSSRLWQRRRESPHPNRTRIQPPRKKERTRKESRRKQTPRRTTNPIRLESTRTKIPTKAKLPPPKNTKKNREIKKERRKRHAEDGLPTGDRAP